MKKISEDDSDRSHGIVSFSIPLEIDDISLEAQRMPNQLQAYNYSDLKSGKLTIGDIVANGGKGDKSYPYFKKSTVGKIGKQTVVTQTEIIDTSVRNSEKCTLELINFSGKLKLLDQIKILVPQKYRDCVLKDQELLFRSGSLIKYPTGGLFTKHRDSVKSHLHIATVLLLLPKDRFPHQGGILKVWDSNGDCKQFEADQHLIIVVAFDPSLYHQCTEITEGTRYIIKTKLALDEKLYALKEMCMTNENVQPQTPKSKREISVNQINNVLEEFQQRLDFFKSEMDTGDAENEELTHFKDQMSEILGDLPRYLPSDEDDVSYKLEAIRREIAKQFKSRKCFVIVPLINFYPSGQEDFLYKIDYDLLKYLRSTLDYQVCMTNASDEPYSGDIRLKDFRASKRKNQDYYSRRGHVDKKCAERKARATVVGMFSTSISSQYIDDKRDHEMFEYDDEISEETRERYDTVVLPSRMGELTRCSEYNDETYDTLYSHKYSCFVVTQAK